MTMMCHIGDEDRQEDSDGSMLTHGFKDHDDYLCPKCGSKHVPVEPACPTCVKNEEVDETHRKIAEVGKKIAEAQDAVDAAVNELKIEEENAKKAMKAIQAACKHPNLYKRHSTLDNSDLWTCDDCLGQWINKP